MGVSRRRVSGLPTIQGLSPLLQSHPNLATRVLEAEAYRESSPGGGDRVPFGVLSSHLLTPQSSL